LARGGDAMSLLMDALKRAEESKQDAARRLTGTVRPQPDLTLEPVAEAPRDAAHFGEGIGIGLRKTDAALKDAFDKAIDAVVGDGTFAKIRAKYFDFEIY